MLVNADGNLSDGRRQVGPGDPGEPRFCGSEMINTVLKSVEHVGDIIRGRGKSVSARELPMNELNATYYSIKPVPVPEVCGAQLIRAPCLRCR